MNLMPFFVIALAIANNEIKVDSALRTKKRFLDAPIVYEATDSIAYSSDGSLSLFGNGKVNYQQVELTSEVINMDIDSSIMHAHGVRDSLGLIKGMPVFKDGAEAYDTEEVRYHLKSKKPR